jgi:hypothetical protein
MELSPEKVGHPAESITGWTACRHRHYPHTIATAVPGEKVLCFQ